MAEMKNLTQNNVTDLKEFFSEKIAPGNPDAMLNFNRIDICGWEPGKGLNPVELQENPGNCKCEKLISELTEKVDLLNRKINRIFGDSFLYNGEFISPKDQSIKRQFGIES